MALTGAAWDKFYKQVRKAVRQMGIDKPTQVEVFTGANLGNNNLDPATQARLTSWTWTKPEGATMVQVHCIGAGGGGGSGLAGAAGTIRGGGWGGGGGAWAFATYPADLLPASVEVTAGLGGAGGAARSPGSNPGSAGGGTSFGAYLVAAGGAAGTGGVPTTTQTTLEPYRYDRGLILEAPRTPPNMAPAKAPGCQAGGGGGSLMADDSSLGIGTGGRSQPFGGGISASDKQDGDDYTGLLVGPGVSGSGGNQFVPALANGGNGGKYGAGGGGGAGGTTSGNPAGSGGRGGDGVCLVVTYF